jgi:aryl carrier-like protein
MKEPAEPEMTSDERDFLRRAEIEAVVTRLWRNALHVEELSPEDNFFELGGDSLLMMTMLARVRGEFGVDLATRVALPAPTLRELCALIANAYEQTAGDEELVQGII